MVHKLVGWALIAGGVALSATGILAEVGVPMALAGVAQLAESEANEKKRGK